MAFSVYLPIWQVFKGAPFAPPGGWIGKYSDSEAILVSCNPWPVCLILYDQACRSSEAGAAPGRHKSVVGGGRIDFRFFELRMHSRRPSKADDGDRSSPFIFIVFQNFPAFEHSQLSHVRCRTQRGGSQGLPAFARKSSSQQYAFDFHYTWVPYQHYCGSFSFTSGFFIFTASMKFRGAARKSDSSYYWSPSL